MQLVQLGVFAFRLEVAVGNVVDASREGVDRGDRAPFLARQHHDPVGEVARALPRQALDLGVGASGRHRANAASASRAREGRGRCVKMSQRAASSASSAARPPRAKSPIARPTRPPMRECKT